MPFTNRASFAVAFSLLAGLCGAQRAAELEPRPIVDFAPTQSLAWIECPGVSVDAAAVLRGLAHVIESRQLFEEIASLPRGSGPDHRILRELAKAGDRNPVVRCVEELVRAELGIAVMSRGAVLALARFESDDGAADVERVLSKLGLPWSFVRKENLLAGANGLPLEQLRDHLSRFSRGETLAGLPATLLAHRSVSRPGRISTVFDLSQLPLPAAPDRSASPQLSLLVGPYVSAFRSARFANATLDLKPRSLRLCFTLPAVVFDDVSERILALGRPLSGITGELEGSDFRMWLRRDIGEFFASSGALAGWPATTELIDTALGEFQVGTEELRGFLERMQPGVLVELCSSEAWRLDNGDASSRLSAAFAGHLPEGALSDRIVRALLRMDEKTALPVPERVGDWDVRHGEPPGRESATATLLSSLPGHLATSGTRWRYDTNARALRQRLADDTRPKTWPASQLDGLEIQLDQLGVWMRARPQAFGLSATVRGSKEELEKRAQLLESYLQHLNAFDRMSFRSDLQNEDLVFQLDVSWTQSLAR